MYALFELKSGKFCLTKEKVVLGGLDTILYSVLLFKIRIHLYMTRTEFKIIEPLRYYDILGH